MSLWPKIRDEGWIYDMMDSKKEAEYWVQRFNDVYHGKIDTWDYQWTFACWLQRRHTVLPNRNLVVNIGFGDEATHTTCKNKIVNNWIDGMKYPLTHPIGMVRNRLFDTRTCRKYFSMPLKARLISKLPNLLKAILFGSHTGF
jgi:hypothetical protein